MNRDMSHVLSVSVKTHKLQLLMIDQEGSRKFYFELDRSENPGRIGRDRFERWRCRGKEFWLEKKNKHFMNNVKLLKKMHGNHRTCGLSNNTGKNGISLGKYILG